MKKFLSFILALTFCFAAFSALAPSVLAADAEFTQKDAKALIDAAVASRELLSEYYPNHMRYVQGAPFELGYKIDWKELYVPVAGQKFGQLYVTLMDHLLPGGSYEGFLADTRSIFTESVAKRYCSEYYHNNDLGLFLTEDGVRYIAAYTAQAPIGFRYDPEKAVIDMIEVTENTVAAKVYCYDYVGLGPDRYDFYVECKFVKTDDGWRIGASDFADMLCSFSEYNYTIVNAPDSGDDIFDTLALCLGGMAVVMSVVCLVRRRRIED